MYWLRWHYHVKDIAGAPYKIKKKSKTIPNCKKEWILNWANQYRVHFAKLLIDFCPLCDTLGLIINIFYCSTL